jgi:hypothetical protein
MTHGDHGVSRPNRYRFGGKHPVIRSVHGDGPRCQAKVKDHVYRIADHPHSTPHRGVANMALQRRVGVLSQRYSRYHSRHRIDFGAHGARLERPLTAYAHRTPETVSRSQVDSPLSVQTAYRSVRSAMSKPVWCTGWDDMEAVGMGAVSRYSSKNKTSTVMAPQMAPAHEGASVEYVSPDWCKKSSDLGKDRRSE